MPIKLLLDTDIGSDIDDAVALAYLLVPSATSSASPPAPATVGSIPMRFKRHTKSLSM